MRRGVGGDGCEADPGERPEEIEGAMKTAAAAPTSMGSPRGVPEDQEQGLSVGCGLRCE